METWSFHLHASGIGEFCFKGEGVHQKQASVTGTIDYAAKSCHQPIAMVTGVEEAVATDSEGSSPTLSEVGMCSDGED